MSSQFADFFEKYKRELITSPLDRITKVGEGRGIDMPRYSPYTIVGKDGETYTVTKVETYGRIVPPRVPLEPVELTPEQIRAIEERIDQLIWSNRR